MPLSRMVRQIWGGIISIASSPNTGSARMMLFPATAQFKRGKHNGASPISLLRRCFGAFRQGAFKLKNHHFASCNVHFTDTRVLTDTGSPALVGGCQRQFCWTKSQAAWSRRSDPLPWTIPHSLTLPRTVMVTTISVVPSSFRRLAMGG